MANKGGHDLIDTYIQLFPQRVCGRKQALALFYVYELRIDWLCFESFQEVRDEELIKNYAYNSCVPCHWFNRMNLPAIHIKNIVLLGRECQVV
jgi:hypothetical protein